MKENKFSLCIIDDEPSGSRTGWDRPFELLIAKGYIDNITPEEAMAENGDWVMDLKILSSETDYKLIKVKNYLEENNGKYDLFIIDLKLDNENFIVGIEFKDLEEKRESLSLAGLDFIEILQEDEKPKIFYTGHDDVKRILRNYEKVNKRLSKDLLLGDIISPGYLNRICDKIDEYLKKIQIQVGSHLTFDFRKKLKRRLESSLNSRDFSEWYKADIKDYRENIWSDNEERCWSLRTLFPRQFNRIKAGDNEDEMKKYIENILEVDWRKLIGCCFSGGKGLLCHPQNMPALDLAKQMAEELDFKTKIKASLYKSMTKLPDFKGDCKHLRDNIIMGKGDDYLIKYDNGKENRRQMSVMEYFTSIFNKNGIDWYKVLNKWASNIGIYPLDIAYISHIAFDNRQHIEGEKVPEFSFSEQADDGSIKSVCLVWRYDALPKDYRNRFTKDSTLYSQFNEALRVKKKNILQTEGIADIIKIILWRYHGAFEIRANQYCIRAKHDEDIFFSDSEGDVIDHTALKIVITEPPKME